MPNRTSIVRGPATVTLNGVKIYALGDVKIDWKFDLFSVPGPLGGQGQQRVKSAKAIVSFTPAGHIDATTLGALYPYASKLPGDSLFGGSDVDCVVSPMAASKTKYTLKNAIVTKMPPLQLSATKTSFGAMEITAFGTSDTDPGTTGSLFTSGTSTADTAYAATTVITQGYDATWGTTPASTIVTKDGWDISFDMAITEVAADFYGIEDVILGDKLILPSAKCNPLYVLQSASPIDIEGLVKTEQAIEQKIGATINDAHAYDLTLANRAGGTTLSVVIKSARIVQASTSFAVGKERFSDLSWVGTEKITSGAYVAPWSITGA